MLETQIIQFNGCKLPNMKSRRFGRLFRTYIIEQMFNKSGRDLYSLAFPNCIFTGDVLDSLLVLLKPFKNLISLDLSGCNISVSKMHDICKNFEYLDNISLSLPKGEESHRDDFTEDNITLQLP
mmetsp:Transcript_15476/g.13517  ORF Transcript_15476/g.13517 Transcript_15476/m.13517 type:complete len:124 (+) Transcript_15476:474-845(+)